MRSINQPLPLTPAEKQSQYRNRKKQKDEFNERLSSAMQELLFNFTCCRGDEITIAVPRHDPNSVEFARAISEAVKAARIKKRRE